MPGDDPFQLQRFLDAQSDDYAQVLAELRQGRKQTHWMWYVFPQLKGLGFSSTAQFYGIGSRVEAEAYLAHPVLGSRLRECTSMVNSLQDRSLREIFGSPDDLKFRSSMTLFATVAPEAPEFQEALERHCNGEPDPKTLELL
jgi:uncharacterized protein (DUF1810 family)